MFLGLTGYGFRGVCKIGVAGICWRCRAWFSPREVQTFGGRKTIGEERQDEGCKRQPFPSRRVVSAGARTAAHAEGLSALPPLRRAPSAIRRQTLPARCVNSVRTRMLVFDIHSSTQVARRGAGVQRLDKEKQ